MASPTSPPDRQAAPTLPDLPAYLGRYRLRERLAAGSYGAVYLGYDEELCRVVAVKVLHAHHLSSPKAVALFQSEARILAQLDHPGIVPVYDLGHTADGLAYLVSKLIEGSDLQARLAEGCFDRTEAVRVVADAAEALHHAHQRGLIHRDIKPANLLMDRDGRVMVTDFGLAMRREDYGTGPSFVGTPLYMSPEQARCESHRVDARTDIYSLGVVFYELLSGEVPFSGSSRQEVLEQIKTQVPPPLHVKDAAIPAELERICLKALAKRASDRYATAQDLADDLRQWIAGRTGSARAPSAAATASFQAVDGPGLPPRVIPRGLRAFAGNDADFFLDLLPGPRDRTGLPESVQFWKTRLEETDPEQTFRVGLLYGPSGCGKSSLVKAGLLPRLAGHVKTVYIEASAEGVEEQLLRALRKRWPGLPHDAGLPQTFQLLRQGQGLAEGEKVVLMLDQFEQWLHAHSEESQPLLVEALRQCDGARVQCLLLVRDDFWLQVSRFMQGLEVRLIEGENTALIDRFDSLHARAVLVEFGRAYGRLPVSPTPLTSDQEAFLDQALEELSEGGRIMPVWLSLFAEMVKGKVWAPATLQKVRGLDGLGVQFLEETFDARTAPAKQRLHAQAAQKVLKALLPEEGTDLKGKRRTYQQLQEAAGYAGRPADFQELLHLLDAELRIVTPIGPAGREGGRESGLDQSEAGGRAPRYYQLTHDYVVQPLRTWIDRNQTATRRGRAALLLATRTAEWDVRRDERSLPSLAEWTRFWLLTKPNEWTEPQRKLMRAANRYHVTHSLIALGLFALLTLAGLYLRRRILDERNAARADQLVAEMTTFHASQLRRFQAEIESYRPWSVLRLQAMIADANTAEDDRLHARVLLLPMDAGQAEPLTEGLLRADPHGFTEVCAALLPHKQEVAAALWQRYEQLEGDSRRRFRAACALAVLDPDNARWSSVGPEVVADLVKRNTLNLADWLEALRPVRQFLQPALQAIFRTREQTLQRALATDALATFVADQPELLAELVLEADPQVQLARVLPIFVRQPAAAAALMNRALDVPPPEPQEAEADRDVQARRRARAAFVLLHLSQETRVWPLLRHSADPSVRTYLMSLLSSQEADPRLLLRRWEQETEPSVRRALLLCLGNCDSAALEPERKEALVRKLLDSYRNDPDSGNHSVSDWLLRRRWDRAKELQAIDDAVAGRPPGERRWFENAQGQTFAIVRGPVEFWMGSPAGETGRDADETLHLRRIPRSFAIATREVTVEQFTRFLKVYPPALRAYAKKFCPDDRGPFIAVSWYESAMYCRWLSEQEHVPEEQMCFPPIAEIKDGMKLPADYLTRTGYRLSTEAEWEYACRAGARTSRWYGTSADFLPQFAWFNANFQGHVWTTGSLPPNELGLFDVYGNICEWCMDRHAPYPSSAGGQACEDREDSNLTVAGPVLRTARGGSFNDQAADLRSAARLPVRPLDHPLIIGLRLARTMP